jgi:hypothetical protein
MAGLLAKLAYAGKRATILNSIASMTWISSRFSRWRQLSRTIGGESGEQLLGQFA